MRSGPALLRLLLGAPAVLVLLLATAPPASAHPTLLSTTPEAGYSVSAAPDQVTLAFDEPVTVEPRGVRLVDADSDTVPTSAVTSEQGGRRIAVGVLSKLDAGRYVVRWRVTAQDGDVVDSGFDFAVASGTAGLRGRETATTAGFPIVVALRWLFFLGLVGTVGGLAGVVIGAESLRNHLGTQHGAVGAVLLATHLAAVSLWAGALAHLLRVARANQGRSVTVRQAFMAYARSALVLFIVVAATGTIGALLLIPTPQAFLVGASLVVGVQQPRTVVKV